MNPLFPLLLLLGAALADTGKVTLPLARDAIAAANKDVAAAIATARAAQSQPKIQVPRELAGELPPAALNSILSSAASLSNGQGPLTILPPRVVAPGEVDQFEKDPQLALHKPKSSRKARQRNRHLQMPYFNPGPGYMDIGSNGFSPLSFAMMRPDAASMSPFVPRNTPPPPIKIQLQDPLQDNYKRLILSESESRVNKEETEHLEKTLETELLALAENFKAARQSVEDTLENVKEKSLTVEQHRQSNQESARNMELQMNKMRQELVAERRNKQIAKLIGDIANATQKPEEKKGGQGRKLEESPRSDSTGHTQGPINLV